MKRKKNVFCSVLLALAMVMSLLPAAAVQAYAEECVNHDMVYWPEGEKDQWDHKVKCTVCDA